MVVRLSETSPRSFDQFADAVNDVAAGCSESLYKLDALGNRPSQGAPPGQSAPPPLSESVPPPASQTSPSGPPSQAFNRHLASNLVARPSGTAWPLLIETDTEKTFGFFHPPAAGTPRDVAVVICNPIGWEAIASHRALRHFAERLAAVGFPVLRFDYPGTGDSSGTDSDPGRLAAWLSGIDAAIAEARHQSGLTKIALLGFHLGGTFATLAAARAGGVESLVLWSPYARGRAYTREAKAYRALNEADSNFPRAEDYGALEAAGFLLSAETLVALDELELNTDERPIAKRALFLERDEKPTPGAFVKHLERLGSEVTRTSVPGYLDMMQEPRKSVLPEAALDVVVRYLSEKHPPAAQAPELAPPRIPRLELAGAGNERIVEQPVTFGADGRFFGILCNRPDLDDRSRPIVLFLTTASHHRVGPNRMWVPMARTLAERGFASLRFDLTGVGDSPTAPGIVEGNVYSSAFVGDVRAAIDFLTRLGYRRFITVGLCSGAYLGFHVSLADDRVTGAVMINPQTFNWKEGDSLDINRRTTFASTRHYKRLILEPNVWKRLLMGDVNVRGIGNALRERLQKRASVELKRISRRLGFKDESGRVDVGVALIDLANRNKDLFLIYGSVDEGLDYLAAEAGSLLAGLMKRREFRIEIIEGPDHTFTQLWAQQHLTRLVVDHVTQRFTPERDRDRGPRSRR